MRKLMIAAGALLAGSALAETAPVQTQVPVPSVHPVASKTFTRAETVAMVREHFSRMDADRNGSITSEEAMQGHREMSGHRKAMRSMHGDGGTHHMAKHDRPRRDPNAAFDRLDSDKDGAISRDEFAKGREQRLERRMVMRDRREGAKDGKQPRKHVMRMHGGHGFAGRMIVMADTDKDGRITLAEAEAMALQHFDQLDSNRDGQVTPEERRAGRAIIRKMIEEKRAS